MTLMICATLSVGFPSYLSQPLEKACCMLYFDCAGRSRYPLVPSPSWNLTPAAGHSGEASVGRGIQPNNARTHTHTQLCNLSSSSFWTHLMKTNELSPLLLQPGSMQRCFEATIHCKECRGCYGFLSTAPLGGRIQTSVHR